VDGSRLFRPGRNLVTVKVVRDYAKRYQRGREGGGCGGECEVTNKMLKDLPHGFYNGDPAGIWQPVSLVITDPLKISERVHPASINRGDDGGHCPQYQWAGQEFFHWNEDSGHYGRGGL